MKKVLIDTLLICCIIYTFAYFFAIEEVITQKVNYDNRDLYEQYTEIEPIDHVQIDEDTSYYVYEDGDKVIVDRYSETLGEALGFYPMILAISIVLILIILSLKFNNWIDKRRGGSMPWMR